MDIKTLSLKSSKFLNIRKNFDLKKCRLEFRWNVPFLATILFKRKSNLIWFINIKFSRLSMCKTLSWILLNVSKDWNTISKNDIWLKIHPSGQRGDTSSSLLTLRKILWLFLRSICKSMTVPLPYIYRSVVVDCRKISEQFRHALPL